MGNLVGDYEILGALGAGGMGTVYKVRHLISDRIEALKMILPDRTATADSTERFLREIRVQASLSHANIASLHNAFRVEGQLFMTMELVEGASLRQKMEPPGVPLALAIGYMEQVLAALSYAHARGVVHRDIKPSNIMVTPAAVVKLLDFGLARGGDDIRLTQSGMFMGSLHYISPEQARGEPASARSDLYSAGVVLYEMLAGKPPFDAESKYAIIAGHLHQTPAAPVTLNPLVPANLSDAVLTALAKEPDRRFQTADQFLSALGARQLQTTATDTVAELPPESLDRVAKNLAQHIGPIARIIVRRAAASHRNLRELCQAVSLEIESDAARRQFLASVAADRITRSTSETPSAG